MKKRKSSVKGSLMVMIYNPPPASAVRYRRRVAEGASRRVRASTRFYF